MPVRPLGPCRQPLCPGRAVYRGYCSKHKSNADLRPSAAQRGYGGVWRTIRERILREAGIPHHLWPLYDVDHEPAYNASIEPDHTKYRLTPRLHSDHSVKTDREDHGFGR
jgi:hypothetical protein